MATGMVSLTIDGIPVDVAKGTRVMVAADSVGVRIPRFCYHPQLSVLGACRICLVAVSTPVIDRATGQPKVTPDTGEPDYMAMRTLQTACTLEVSPGMRVVTDSREVIEGREAIIELILAHHPLDCPICDKGGECELQEMTMVCGPARQVFTETRRSQDKARRIGAGIVLDQERCIVCFRCTRFLEEWAREKVFEFHDRGGDSIIEPAFGDPIPKARFAGNTIDLCPVGALTSDSFRFSARPWELADTPGVCPLCPVGCNLVLGGRLGTLCRVQPRANYQVNDTWICYRARYGFDWVGKDRLSRPSIADGPGGPADVAWDAALDRAAEALRSARDPLFVVDPATSCETGWMLSRLIGALGKGSVHVCDDHDAGGAFQGTIMDVLYSDLVLLVSADVLEDLPVLWLRMSRRAAEGRQRMIAVSPKGTCADQKSLASARAHPRPGYEAELLAALADVVAGSEPPSALDEAAAKVGVRGEWLVWLHTQLTQAKRPAVIANCDDPGRLPGLREAVQRLAGALQTGRRVAVAHGVLAGGANSRGLRVVGLASAKPGAARGELMRSGAHDLVFALGGDPLAGTAGAAGNVGIAFLGTNHNSTSGAAQVRLAAASFQEEPFSLVNFEGRLQFSEPTNEPIEDTLPTFEILARLCGRLGVAAPDATAPAIRAAMAQAGLSAWGKAPSSTGEVIAVRG